MTPFGTYWKIIGYPLSSLKGMAVDFLPFAVTEILLWLGIGLTIILLFKCANRGLHFFFPGFSKRYFSGKKVWMLLILGPGLLFYMAAGQGVFPFHVVPSGLKKNLYKSIAPPRVSEEHILSALGAAERELKELYQSDLLAELDDDSAITWCNQALEKTLGQLNGHRGRTVRRVKKMRGFSRLLGLSYGGPAYHDPLTSELAIVRAEDLPTPQYWRTQAICHETAHAKGFPRELDAEIITQLALWYSDHPALRAAGWIQFLEKSGYPVDWPDALKAERARATEARKKIQAGQCVVNFLKRVNKKLSLQNSAKKYGDRKPGEAWDPGDPYFTTILHLAARLFISENPQSNEERK